MAQYGAGRFAVPAFYPGSPGSNPGRSIYFDFLRFALTFLVLGGGVSKSLFTTASNGIGIRASDLDRSFIYGL